MKNPQTFNRYSYGLNSPYKFVDPLGLVASSITEGTPSVAVTAREEERNKCQSTSEGCQGQTHTKQIPTTIVVEVGEQKNYNGDKIKFPNGTETDDGYYGVGRVNKIKVLDQNGKPMEADSGYTLREDVKLEKATPEEAKNIISKSETTDLTFEEGQPGVIYDKVGPLSTNP
jgi:hypothetical protein